MHSSRLLAYRHHDVPRRHTGLGERIRDAMVIDKSNIRLIVHFEFEFRSKRPPLTIDDLFSYLLDAAQPDPREFSSSHHHYPRVFIFPHFLVNSSGFCISATSPRPRFVPATTAPPYDFVEASESSGCRPRFGYTALHLGDSERDLSFRVCRQCVGVLWRKASWIVGMRLRLGYRRSMR
ncbi:hypothetical protein BDQ17DRAFT_1102887 [Cyathus striatus]|nr:hypothetical protein BDQ17DRAFT_1102887 [Cyathus striatus]